MPEGPEVRTIARELRPMLEGKDILAVKMGTRAKCPGLDAILLPRKITMVSSRGKKLLFHLDRGAIVTSLGMEGRWSPEEGKHSHISIEYGKYIDDVGYVEGELYFDDSRYFGHVDLLEEGEVETYLSKLGPDPLSRNIPSDEWKDIWAQRKIRNWKVSKALLEQSVISGVGNYLRSEILYRARISPHRIVGQLTPGEVEWLRKATIDTMKESYSCGGLTLRSFWSPKGNKGTYPARIYGKRNIMNEGQTFDVVREKVDGRAIFWDPRVQI